MPTLHRRLAAFTLVELLVVIAVIGVLISLLLPAVQQAREAGRRSQCSNNLKQVGLAYQCYESAYQSFPPGYISDQTKPAGWGIFLLPYIELKTLYDQYNFKLPFFAGNNQQIANTSIPCFLCPSAPIRGPYSYTLNYPGFPSVSWQASASDYSPLARVHEDLVNTFLGLGYTAEQRMGALQPDKPTTPNAISDGLSHTILVAEMAGKNDLWQNGKNFNQQLSGMYGGQGGWADATSAASVLIGSTSDGSTAPGDNGINCSNDYGLYSFHRVLANSLFADGSVRSLSTEIDIRELVGLVTRAGGEIEDAQ